MDWGKWYPISAAKDAAGMGHSYALQLKRQDSVCYLLPFARLHEQQSSCRLSHVVKPPLLTDLM